LSGGGVSTWTSSATIVVSSRRFTLFRALTGATPSSGQITIDCGGQTQTYCGAQFVAVADALLTGTNGADAIGQAVITAGALTGTALPIVLGDAWDGTDSRGLVCWFKANNTTITLTASGFTQLASTAVSGFTLTAFHGRDAAALDLSATAGASSGTYLGIGLEVAGAADDVATPVTFDYPGVRQTGLNGRLN